jgi:hypothetical protein
MFIALDKLANQGLRQAIIVVPEKSIGASFHNEPLSQFGFWADWVVEPRWNLCDAPGGDNGGKVDAVKKFLDSEAPALVCTHATFRFAMEKFGVEAFDRRLIAVDEFHHVSANPDNTLGDQVRQLMARDQTHVVAMTGSYFRGDAEAVLHPEDEAKFETVTYTYYEQLNDELFAALKAGADPQNDITRLTHVRSRQEIKAAAEIAQRVPCLDFAQLLQCTTRKFITLSLR